MRYYPEFAEQINKALARLDRSPSWLAQRLGVNPSTVSRWLNQGARPRNPETVIRVADILGLSGQVQALLAATGYGYVETAGVSETKVGLGGQGKTRLAQAVVTAIADALDFPFQPDERSPKQQLLDFLRCKEMLLVLANCEHLLDGADLVRDLLTIGLALQVLATSRERLNLTAEAVYVLEGIDFAGGTDTEAVQLFLHSASLVRPDYRPGWLRTALGPGRSVCHSRRERLLAK